MNQAPDAQGFENVEELVDFIMGHSQFGALDGRRPDNSGFRLAARFAEVYLPGRVHIIFLTRINSK